MAELASRKRALPAVLVALLGAAVFLPSVIDGRLLDYDDNHYVPQSAAIAHAEVARIVNPLASRADLGEEYLPVRDLTWVVSGKLAGLGELHDNQTPPDDPRWTALARSFRAQDLALYALACALAFLFLEELLRDAPLAFLAAAFFAVHPVHAESAAWISSRKDVLSGALGLLALLLQVRGRLVPAVLAGAAAMLSKSTLTCLPVLVFVVELAKPALRRERSGITGEPASEAPTGFARVLARTAPHGVVAVVVVVTAMIVGARTGIRREPPPGGLATVFATDLTILVRYVSACFFPRDLSVSYAWPLRSVWRAGDLPVIARAALPLGLLAALGALAARRRPRLLAFGGVWFLAGLLPVLNLVPFVQWIADRYLFLPVLGPCVVLAWVVVRARRRPLVAAGLALVIASALGLQAVRRGLDFTTDERLWRAALACDDANPVAHHQLGRALLARARSARRAGQIEQAQGFARVAQAEEDLAIRIFDQPGAIWAGPVLEARHGLAEALELEGEPVAAVTLERATLLMELEQGHPDARRKLGRLARLAEAAPIAGYQREVMLVEAARCYAAAGEPKKAVGILKPLEQRQPELVAKAIGEDPLLRALVRDP